MLGNILIALLLLIAFVAVSDRCAGIRSWVFSAEYDVVEFLRDFMLVLLLLFFGYATATNQISSRLGYFLDQGPPYKH